jgi:transposase
MSNFKVNHNDGIYQQGKPRSQEVRTQVLHAALHKEMSINDICTKFGVSESSAYRWIKSYLEEGRLEPLHTGEPGCVLFH